MMNWTDDLQIYGLRPRGGAYGGLDVKSKPGHVQKRTGEHGRVKALNKT